MNSRFHNDNYKPVFPKALACLNIQQLQQTHQYLEPPMLKFQGCLWNRQDYPQSHTVHNLLSRVCQTY